MTTSKRDLLIVALRNAYALEGQAETNLSTIHGRLEHYPELKARIGQHLEETKRQKARVEECLGQLGESPSSLKETATKLAASVQGMFHMTADDEVLKNAFTAYAFEHFEIASYKSLIAMAEACGETQIATACQGILREEETTAQWLGENIESITRAYVGRETAGLEAKG
ncbi:MAG: ferritin-like domain-containing protein [Geminicoccaceae bacterium]|nr:ferritin-like domain-containing protein [Geminicoccaceae bacterium]